MRIGSSITIYAIQLIIIAAGTTMQSCTKQPENYTTQEIEANLDYRMNYFIQLYGSKEKLEAVTGKSCAQLKEIFRPVIAEQIIIERARQSGK